jgi:hypothetical protein
MIPKLTDEAVSRLSLESGRAELLEEIMTAVAPDRQTDEPTPSTTPRRSRWLVPLGVAAAVATVASAPLWWGSADEKESKTPDVSFQTAPESPGSGYRAVVTAPGWQVDGVEEDSKYGGEVRYTNGGQQLTITWYPEETYQDYLVDRQHIVESPVTDDLPSMATPTTYVSGAAGGTLVGASDGTETTEGDPVTVLGRAGHLWAYTSQDHTVMREPDLGHWMEFRGAGMDRAAFEELLTHLRLVSLAEFESALPSSFVTADDRPAAVRAILDGIEGVTGVTVPAGTTLDTRSDEQDPYHLGADIAGQYACAWISEFAHAKSSGDQARADEAARVMGTSRQWPVLQEMDAEGDFSEVIWDYADTISAGQVPGNDKGEVSVDSALASVTEGLGC